MKTTKNSVEINNNPEFEFRLELDDIAGYIRLTKNDLKKKTTKITDRNIPVDVTMKNTFHRDRTAYSEIPSEEFPFIGSYISRKYNGTKYKVWKDYIIAEYRRLRNAYKKSSKNKVYDENIQLSIFEGMV